MIACLRPRGPYHRGIARPFRRASGGREGLLFTQEVARDGWQRLCCLTGTSSHINDRGATNPLRLVKHVFMGHLGRLEVPRDLLLSICVHELAALDLRWGPEKHQVALSRGTS